MTPPNTLGARIRHRRRQLGFSLDDLAGLSSVSKGYLSLIETGKANAPRDGKLVAIATALSLHASVLLDFKYEPVEVCHA